jgi:hypothetical protein
MRNARRGSRRRPYCRGTFPRVLTTSADPQTIQIDCRWKLLLFANALEVMGFRVAVAKGALLKGIICVRTRRKGSVATVNGNNFQNVSFPVLAVDVRNPRGCSVRLVRVMYPASPITAHPTFLLNYFCGAERAGRGISSLPRKQARGNPMKLARP